MCAQNPPTIPKKLSALLTTEDVAKILRINVQTVRRMVRARRLPVCIGAGRHWRFTEDGIAQYIQDTSVLAAKPAEALHVAGTKVLPQAD